ncbi:hypothetical protein A6E15_05840 [Natrinema saccharevitans]|uniref:Uncharacterized protein n=1 Tax=Natrinema saccharevitans TaxID=301967 RepID=A0A1S8AV02_9EURY|nr:hypothetical protein [Natrinema saccharevitans]OLZ40540.1 hypothetical protein A6E15_05840 [Natrinema saccharevitans]
MTDLTIPADAGTDRIKTLVQDHLEIGDTVEVRDAERTEDHGTDVVGEVTGFEPGYLEIDGRSLDEGSVRYDEIHTVGKIEG